MAAMAMTPATTPPAMAPAFDPLPDEEDTDVADTGVKVEALEIGLLALTLEETDVPTSCPGKTSGVSPMASAAVTFQRFTSVMSWRAHRGTRVVGGTGLGNVEGSKVLVQLSEKPDQLLRLPPWHAPQALKRSNDTVLHQHKLASSDLGPKYENEEFSIGTKVNAPP